MRPQESNIFLPGCKNDQKEKSDERGGTLWIGAAARSFISLEEKGGGGG